MTPEEREKLKLEYLGKFLYLCMKDGVDVKDIQSHTISCIQKILEDPDIMFQFITELHEKYGKI